MSGIKHKIWRSESGFEYLCNELEKILCGQSTAETLNAPQVASLVSNFNLRLSSERSVEYLKVLLENGYFETLARNVQKLLELHPLFYQSLLPFWILAKAFVSDKTELYQWVDDVAVWPMHCLASCMELDLLSRTSKREYVALMHTLTELYTKNTELLDVWLERAASENFANRFRLPIFTVAKDALDEADVTQSLQGSTALMQLVGINPVSVPFHTWLLGSGLSDIYTGSITATAAHLENSLSTGWMLTSRQFPTRDVQSIVFPPEVPITAERDFEMTLERYSALLDRAKDFGVRTYLLQGLKSQVLEVFLYRCLADTDRINDAFVIFSRILFHFSASERSLVRDVMEQHAFHRLMMDAVLTFYDKSDLVLRTSNSLLQQNVFTTIRELVADSRASFEGNLLLTEPISSSRRSLSNRWLASVACDFFNSELMCPALDHYITRALESRNTSGHMVLFDHSTFLGKVIVHRLVQFFIHPPQANEAFTELVMELLLTNNGYVLDIFLESNETNPLGGDILHWLLSIANFVIVKRQPHETGILIPPLPDELFEHIVQLLPMESPELVDLIDHFSDDADPLAVRFTEFEENADVLKNFVCKILCCSLAFQIVRRKYDWVVQIES